MKSWFKSTLAFFFWIRSELTAESRSFLICSESCAYQEAASAAKLRNEAWGSQLSTQASPSRAHTMWGKNTFRFNRKTELKAARMWAQRKRTLRANKTVNWDGEASGVVEDDGYGVMRSEVGLGVELTRGTSLGVGRGE